jgi:O-antigen/teichoic acid export membrane protein
VKNNNSIQQRALKNSVVGLFSLFITLIQAFVTVPILLGIWGSEIYGIWLALFAGFTLFQSVDNGHINYVGNKINLLYHSDKEELRKTLGSSFLIAVIIGASQLLLTLILIFFNFLPDFFGIPLELLNELSVPMSLLILIITWYISGSFGGIIHRLMIPAGLYTQSLWWGILYKISQFTSIVVVALLGGGIFTVSLVYSLIQLSVYLLTFIYIKNKIPEFFPWWECADWKTAFSNFRKSFILTVNGISQQLSNNGVILLISSVISTSIVPAFATMRTITNTASSVTGILISSLLPDIAKFHAKKESSKLNIIFNSHWFFSGIIVNIGLILILPFIEDIYIFWTKGILQFDYGLFISLAASISLINFGSGYYFYLTSINSLTAQTVITAVRVVLVFGTGYYFISLYGLVGIGISIMISEIICSTILPALFVKRELKRTGCDIQKKYFLLALLPPVVILFYAALMISNDKLNYSIWVIFILIITAIYIFNWKLLDSSVKMRMKELIYLYFRLS